jgi:hypothetical protein
MGGAVLVALSWTLALAAAVCGGGFAPLVVAIFASATVRL